MVCWGRVAPRWSFKLAYYRDILSRWAYPGFIKVGVGEGVGGREQE